MRKYVIIDENDGMMLAAIGIKRVNGHMTQDHAWTQITAEALHFEVQEEAEAVINFINDVIDWELAQQLHVEDLKGEGLNMSKDEHERPEPWCFPDVTCKHGYYPYCPTCEHGLVIQEEWMQEDQCQWVCLLDNKE